MIKWLIIYWLWHDILKQFIVKWKLFMNCKTAWQNLTGNSSVISEWCQDTVKLTRNTNTTQRNPQKAIRPTCGNPCMKRTVCQSNTHGMGWSRARNRSSAPQCQRSATPHTHRLETEWKWKEWCCKTINEEFKWQKTEGEDVTQRYQHHITSVL